MLSFECIKNEKSVYFLLTSALHHSSVQSATTAPPHITLHLPIHRTKVFRENEVRRLYNSFSNRCEDAGT